MSLKFSDCRSIVYDLARQSLPAASPLPVAPPDSIGQAIPAARLLLADDPVLHPQLARGLQQLGQPAPSGARPMLCDSLGHRREVYHLLALHLHLRAFNRRYETLSPSLWSQCEEALTAAIEPAMEAQQTTGTPAAAEQAPRVLWQALCIYQQAVAVARDADIELVDAIVQNVVNRPGPDGALHPMGDEESLDAWTYHELCGLHALANLALGRRNRTWARRVEQVAMYHLERTQPDHVTTQPWGLFAFCWSDQTRSFAEQQLHDVQTQMALNPAESGAGLSGLLLADAFDALSQFGA